MKKCNLILRKVTDSARETAFIDHSSATFTANNIFSLLHKTSKTTFKQTNIVTSYLQVTKAPKPQIVWARQQTLQQQQQWQILPCHPPPLFPCIRYLLRKKPLLKILTLTSSCHVLIHKCFIRHQQFYAPKWNHWPFRRQRLPAEHPL